MNEDENGITPPGVTSMTIDRSGLNWRVIIEQGNGDVIKIIELTEMERVQLGMILETSIPREFSISFTDVTR